MGRPEVVRRVRVWSGGLRWAHWMVALGVLGLLATGFMIVTLPGERVYLDYHYLAGYVLVAGLLVRIYLLLFARAEGHWRALLPGRGTKAASLAMLRFYFSLGRFPLPRWYAHNPLWGPIYLVLFLVLIAQVVTGLGLGEHWLPRGPTLAWHLGGARLILGFTVLHVIAVVLQDIYGTGSDCSAMINGHRTFVQPPSVGGLDALDAQLRSMEDRSAESPRGDGQPDDKEDR